MKMSKFGLSYGQSIGITMNNSICKFGGNAYETFTTNHHDICNPIGDGGPCICKPYR